MQPYKSREVLRAHCLRGTPIKEATKRLEHAQDIFKKRHPPAQEGKKAMAPGPAESDG